MNSVRVLRASLAEMLGGLLPELADPTHKAITSEMVKLTVPDPMLS